VLRVLGPRLDGRTPDDVTLLGNGGAARAVLVALRMLGAVDVRIQARDLSAAYKLAVEFGLSEHPRVFDVPIETHGLVNATPMGMAGVQPHPLDIGPMPSSGWVFDMVTDPAETDLLRIARARGLATIDGLAMLVEQAADSFMLMFGQEAPRDFDAELMARIRA
jgi:shikimate dehydrogenase